MNYVLKPANEAFCYFLLVVVVVVMVVVVLILFDGKIFILPTLTIH
jgi:hypothetical protein